MLFSLTAWSASGCANAYRSLPSEDDVPELAAMKRLSEAVPQRTIRIAVRTSRGHTLRVALHESGPADAPRTIVLIHGVLSDSSLWRHVRGELALEHRVILVDLP